jgi:hypothetical protein
MNRVSHWFIDELGGAATSVVDVGSYFHKSLYSWYKSWSVDDCRPHFIVFLLDMGDGHCMSKQVQNFGFHGSVAEQQQLPGFALLVHRKVIVLFNLLWRSIKNLPFFSISTNKFTMKDQPIFLKCIAFSQFSPKHLEKNIDELVASVQDDANYIKNLFPKESIDSNHKQNLVLLPILGLLAGSLDTALIERVWNCFCGESTFDPLWSISEAIEEYI